MTLLKKIDEPLDRDVQDPEILEQFGGAEVPDHPDFERLAAWRDAKLTGAEREEFRRHVENCEECRDFLLLTDDGEMANEDRDPRLADLQEAATWRAVQAEIRAERAREAAGAARQREIRERRRRRFERWTLAAASLLLVFLLGAWALRQSRALGKLSQPQMNVAIHDVLEIAPRGPDEPGDAPPRVFEVPPGTEFFTLVLPVDDAGYDLYRMRLYDAEGRLIWSGEGLEIDRFGVATLGLSRRFLTAGLYRLDVEGRLEDGEYEAVGSSKIDVRYP